MKVVLTPLEADWVLDTLAEDLTKLKRRTSWDFMLSIEEVENLIKKFRVSNKELYPKKQEVAK